MKVGDLVNYAKSDTPLARFRRNGGVVMIAGENNNDFGTIVYWFQDKQYTRESGKYLVVISESR